MCEQVGGICTTERDGYYAMSAICVIVGVIVLVTYVKPTARRLQSMFAFLTRLGRGALTSYI